MFKTTNQTGSSHSNPDVKQHKEDMAQHQQTCKSYKMLGTDINHLPITKHRICNLNVADQFLKYYRSRRKILTSYKIWISKKTDLNSNMSWRLNYLDLIKCHSDSEVMKDMVPDRRGRGQSIDALKVGHRRIKVTLGTVEGPSTIFPVIFCSGSAKWQW